MNITKGDARSASNSRNKVHLNALARGRLSISERASQQQTGMGAIIIKVSISGTTRALLERMKAIVRMMKCTHTPIWGVMNEALLSE